VVQAGGYTGVAHLDARLADDGSISLLECNARFWSSIFALASAGVNFVEWGMAGDLAYNFRRRHKMRTGAGCSG